MFTSSKIVLPIVLIAVLGGGIYWYSIKPIAPIQKACTMEAKLCPDGSAVGRTGPNCEFAACPTVGGGGATVTGGIKGVVLLGPTCPVERIPPDPQCADRPYITALVATTPDGSRTIAQFSSDSMGKFSVDIPPGNYVVRQAPGSSSPFPRCSSDNVTVKSGTYADLTVYCDTGIR